MARPDAAPTLDRGDKVVAATDLRGVPAGTKGKVALVNGLSWIRYWVRFDNGVSTGSINRANLATPEEWTRRLAGGDEVVESVVASADGDGDEGGAADGGLTVNGVLVPAKLIERTKAARARLTA